MNGNLIEGALVFLCDSFDPERQPPVLLLIHERIVVFYLSSGSLGLATS